MNKKITILFFLIVLGIGQLAFAEIKFFAEVDRTTVGLDSAIQLSLTVNGAQNATPVEVKAIDGFDVKYVGPSRRVSIVNGQYSSSITFNYALYPKKVGVFTIPALTADADGKQFSSIPIKVNVQATSAAKPADGGQVKNLEDKIFLAQRFEKNEVYVGEKVKIQIGLFVADLKVGDIEYPKLDAAGINFEDYLEPKQGQQVINGVRYNVVVFERYFYPKKSGTIIFKPATTTCQILIAKSSSNNLQNQFGDVFDQNFMNDFFNLQDKRPITLNSGIINLTVKDLPVQGQPDHFSGAVGKFDFDATVSPTAVKVGDPLTVKMSVTGEGNLRDLKFPEINRFDQFKDYDPTVKIQDNTKSLEQVAIPKDQNIKEFPVLTFSYFDPAIGQYRSITKGPFKLEVTPAEAGDQLKVVEFDKKIKRLEPEKLGEDILFIKEDWGSVHRFGDHFYYHFGFYLLWFLILGVWGSAYYYFFYNERLRTDSKFAKSLKAPRHARQGFAKAMEFLERQKVKEFYDVLFETVALYMVNKFDLPLGEIASVKLNERFKGDTRWQNVSSAVASLFDECDAVRFAQAKIDGHRMREAYIKAEKIIDYLERNY
ncbi:MAG: protein BatD [Candidatus Omnitrophica bacterium]|nr:protein BatD [Candidatus Omnitrophota bacterium]